MQRASSIGGGASPHSLIGAEDSLLAFQKFPVRPSREFAVQDIENAGEIWHENRPGRAFLREIPVKIPVSREFAGNFRG
jgi:hypothetical protein